jgi:hypothetical protein
MKVLSHRCGCHFPSDASHPAGAGEGLLMPRHLTRRSPQQDERNSTGGLQVVMSRFSWVTSWSAIPPGDLLASAAFTPKTSGAPSDVDDRVTKLPSMNHKVRIIRPSDAMHL